MREEERSRTFLPILSTFGSISDNGYTFPAQAVGVAPAMLISRSLLLPPIAH